MGYPVHQPSPAKSHRSFSVPVGSEVSPPELVATSPIAHLVRAMAPVLGLYALYLFVRYLVRDRGPAQGMANAYEVLRIERFLRIDWESWIQSAQLPHRWLLVAANWYYVAGFLPVVIGIACLTAMRNHPAFLWWRSRFAVTLLIAMIGFASFPLAPPRMLPDMVDTLTTYGPHYYGNDHGSSLFNAYGRMPSLVNVYAAMPSMHVAWSIIAGAMLIAAFNRARWAVVIGVLHPVLMSWAVITTANHYLLDVVIGVATLVLAIGVLQIVDRMRTRQEHESA